MRRVVLTAVVLLMACQPPAELEVSAPPRPWDLFTDGTASATLQRLSEAAGSDQVLDVTMRRDLLRATFQTPSGPRPFQVSQDETSPTPNPARSTDVDPFTRQANLDRLDELAAELGAPSRTALLVQALRLYLKETS
ncbi:MAG: ribbon-helix-helix domain-containing protein [Actinomycetia bacterium]|nr:ribbon-helix-helix domain-containing protein [Actinomycetes bacterium]